MSQRLIRKTHPHTGEALRPVGKRKDGRLIWPILGASEDDDKTGDDDGASGASDDDKTGDEGQSTTPPPGDTISRAEYDKIVERMKAADKRADENAQKVKQYEDKDKTELELATGRVAELEAENTQLAEALQTQVLENAFLKSNSVKWHDPRLALAQVDLSDVMDSDGNVDEQALAKAITELAKDKPFLVKGDEGDDDGEDKTPPQSGPKLNGTKKDKKELDREKLLAKYPALRR